MRRAPASTAFSTSSLTTEAGRSTTSPGRDLVDQRIRQPLDAALLSAHRPPPRVSKRPGNGRGSIPSPAAGPAAAGAWGR